MRKYLLENKKYYKANLHSHSSTLSDGKFTLEENVKAYKERGYSVYAITDHYGVADMAGDYTDENFVVINGYEAALYDSENYEPDVEKRRRLKTYHFNMFPIEQDTLSLVGVLRQSAERFKDKFEKTGKRVGLPYNGEFQKHGFGVEVANEMIKKATEAGYLVQLNHPVWSLLEPKDYLGLKGLWGLEIYNHGCVEEGYDERNGIVYDYMLKDGQTPCITASDDNHKEIDMFGGFTMIGANALNYKEVLSAMQRKDLYASEGPLFSYIYYEDGKFFIKTEPPVKKITLTTGGRFTRIAEDKTGLTEAVFEDFDTDYDFKYYRFEITDLTGKKAYTKAYLKKEIL